MHKQTGGLRLPFITWVMLSLLLSIVLFAAVQLHAETQTNPADAVQQTLAQGKPTVVEFGSDSCASCKKMTQTLQQLQHSHGNDVGIVNINIIKQPEYTRRYGIMLIPTQVFYNAQGEEIERHMGILSAEEILDILGVNS